MWIHSLTASLGFTGTKFQQCVRYKIQILTVKMGLALKFMVMYCMIGRMDDIRIPLNTMSPQNKNQLMIIYDRKCNRCFAVVLTSPACEMLNIRWIARTRLVAVVETINPCSKPPRHPNWPPQSLHMKYEQDKQTHSQSVHWRFCGKAKKRHLIFTIWWVF